MSPHLRLGTSGHLLRSSGGHLVIECDESPEPTCDIVCSELASAYTVLGVSSLTSCASCISSPWPHWDGVMEYSGGCLWQLNTVSSINGRLPSFSSGIGAGCPDDGWGNGVGVWYNRGLCRWELAITCRSTFDYHVIWSGTKEVEFGPVGVYTRFCGCDETPTLTVV